MDTERERDPVLLEAIKVAGGAIALGEQLGLSRGAVSQWRRVPPQHVLAIESLTGISRHRLRPDVCGPTPAEAAA